MLPTLEMRNVGLNYHSREGETVAIDDISFCINKNEFVGLVGPSGCGKTTILSLISGILTPSRGQVLIERQKHKNWIYVSARFVVCVANNYAKHLFRCRIKPRQNITYA